MRKPALLVAIAFFLAVSPARGEGPVPLSGGCTDPGSGHGYCARVVLSNSGAIYWELESIDRAGRVEVCVADPKGKESCSKRKLSFYRSLEAWVAKVVLVPGAEEKGSYVARWIEPRDGHQLGPRLRYTVM